MPSSSTASRRALLAVGATAALPGAAAGKRRGRRPKPTGRCAPDAVGFLTFETDVRYAVAFTAARTGRLRRIEVGVQKPSTGAGDWGVQLLRANGNALSHLATDAIAASVVPDAGVPTGSATLVAAFVGPVLQAGVFYAVAVSRLGSSLGVGLVEDGSCSPSVLFLARGADPFEQFDPSTNAAAAFAVFVD